MKPYNLILACGMLFLLIPLSMGQATSASRRVTPNSENKISGILQPGVIVEDVTKSLMAEKVGLEVGDILLSWSRGDAKGEIESPFDFNQILAEQASQGPVTIYGFRKDEKRVWIIGQSYLGIMRPNLGEPLLSSYREAQALTKAGKPHEAAERWQTAAVMAQESSSTWLSSWFLFRAAQVLAEAHLWKESDSAYQQAVEQAKGANPRFRVTLFRQWAISYENRYDWINTEKYSNQALAEWRKLGNENMLVASGLFDLGVHAFNRGDLPAAESYIQQAAAIQEKLAPASLSVAASWGNLGNIFSQRGDLTTAERYYHRDLAIEEKLAPGSHNFAMELNNLGQIARQRGDLATAEKYHRRALAVLNQLDPHGGNVASTLEYLGEILLLKGDFVKAEDYQRKALAISEKRGPPGFHSSSSLKDLGDIARARGNLAKAEYYYQQALTIREKLAPGTLALAQILNQLGTVALQNGNLGKAEDSYYRALAICKKLVPRSADHAESLAGLAEVKARQLQPDAAAQLYEDALDALGSQTAHLGGGEEAGANFRAMYSGYYKNYIDLLVRQKKFERGFQVLERLRARTLLEALTTARADIRQGIDPSLAAKERLLQESLSAKWNRRMQLSGKQQVQEQMAAFDNEINDLLAQYKNVEEQIKASSPSYAALTQPQPLTAQEVQQQLLDDNTLLLEYSLGQERSYVFAVTPDSLNAYELPKRTEIESVARHVYQLLTEHNRKSKGEKEAQRQKHVAKAEAEYSQAVAELSRMVLGPVAGQLQGKRLLIVSDGALQYIPFAALPAPEASGSKPSVPLVAEHEIVNLPSASVLAVLRREQIDRKEGSKAIAVLADPVFVAKDDRVQLTLAANGESNPKLPADSSVHLSAEPDASSDEPSDLDRSAQEMGLSGFPRLPFTRREAETIYSIAGKSDALEALDFDASKATALSSQLKDYRIVHFATHGLLNNEHPELSGLVLSLVDRQGKSQDGFLRMLDIYNMQLNADLVVLSACQTALGKEIG
ncbi:MAG TPA: tetratricopeptide repeat protein, partial [Candidatus Angelobacter sp.]|nr:tetratricopeptide repeat protein [Candidatus Angelobacter sp.]